MDTILIACPLCATKVPPGGVEKHVQQCLAEQEERRKQQQEALARLEEFQRLQTQMLDYQKAMLAAVTAGTTPPPPISITAPSIGLFYSTDGSHHAVQPQQPQPQHVEAHVQVQPQAHTHVQQPQQQPQHVHVQPPQQVSVQPPHVEAHVQVQPQAHAHVQPPQQTKHVEVQPQAHTHVQQQPQQQPQHKVEVTAFNPFLEPEPTPAPSPAKAVSAGVSVSGDHHVAIAFNPFLDPPETQHVQPAQQPQHVQQHVHVQQPPQHASPQLQRREVHIGVEQHVQPPQLQLQQPQHVHIQPVVQGSPQLQRRDVHVGVEPVQVVSRQLFVEEVKADLHPQQQQWVAFGQEAHVGVSVQHQQQPQPQHHQPQHEPQQHVVVAEASVVEVKATVEGDVVLIPPPEKKRTRKTSHAERGMGKKALSQSALPTSKEVAKRKEKQKKKQDEVKKAIHDLDNYEKEMEKEKEDKPKHKEKAVASSPSTPTKKDHASKVPSLSRQSTSPGNLERNKKAKDDSAAEPKKKKKGFGKALTLGRSFLSNSKKESSHSEAPSSPSKGSPLRATTKAWPTNDNGPPLSPPRGGRSPGSPSSPSQSRIAAAGYSSPSQTRSPHQPGDVRWFWKKDEQTWDKFDRRTSEIIDKAYREEKATVDIGNNLYVDFKLLVQKSHKDPLHRCPIKRKIRVQREQPKPQAEEVEDEQEPPASKHKKKEKLTFL